MSLTTLTCPRTAEANWEQDAESIRQRVAEIRNSWSQEERERRAEMGEARREQLLSLLLGAELQTACA